MANSTFEYLKYVCERESFFLKVSFYFRWYIAKVLRFFRAYTPAQHTDALVYVLRGLSRTALVAYSKEYWRCVLQQRGNPRALALIRRLEVDDSELFVVSAGIDFIIEPFLEQHRFRKAYTSELEFDHNNICTGRYKRNVLREGKLHVLSREFTPKELSESYFLTDDETQDRDLIEAVKKSIILKSSAGDSAASKYRVLLEAFPFHYTLKTRYNVGDSLMSSVRLLFYLGKFWIPFTIIFSGHLRSFASLAAYAFEFVLFLLAFANLYELGYLYNDYVSVRREVNPTLRAGHLRSSVTRVALTKLLYLAILYIAILSYSPDRFADNTLLACALTVIFYAHNKVDVKARIITYHLLLFLKPCVALVPFLHCARSGELAMFFAFDALHALSYVPAYAMKKLYPDRGNARTVYTQPLFWKNLFFLPLTSFSMLIGFPVQLTVAIWVYINAISIVQAMLFHDSWPESVGRGNHLPVPNLGNEVLEK
ncbi:MAG: HAD-IB family phosphatase [Planctomycetes bacterium]|nr:HAD-IB family phosphatase [Planctomycetota bacterium]